MMMVIQSSEDMTPILNRLKRAQDQLGCVIRRIEAGRDGRDVVTQLAIEFETINRAAHAAGNTTPPVSTRSSAVAT